MLEIGSLVDGKYKILNKVGQGGMSVVYLAMNEKANKQWAVKEVRKDGVKDFEVVKQGLVAETDILKKLSHPNLPSIIDVIDTDDSFIIIMDYIQGNSLNKALQEFGAQPQEHVIEWAKQLCDVLGYLHSRTPAIIYRDMKPANIMLKPDGNVTLIDFGTAREFKEKNLADTTCLGTVGYAAPEQFGGMGQTDARTDIYCLGATLYHLVTGMNPCEPPYEIKPIREINPMLSSGLERIILKCTQRDPNDRYQSAAELMYALEHYEEIDDIYRKKQKRKLSAFLTTSILTVAFAATSVFGYVSATQKKSEDYSNQLKKLGEMAEAVANQEESYSTAEAAYYETILLDPTKGNAYLAFNDFCISDYELDDNEIAGLTKLSMKLDEKDSAGNIREVDVLSKLKESNPEAYEEVCFEIGWSFLSYSKQTSGMQDLLIRYDRAVNWFELIKDSKSDNGATAKLLCDMYECINSLSKVQQSYGTHFEEEKELEAKIWENLQKVCKSAENYNIDSQVQIWTEINTLISYSISDFVKYEISADDILSLLNEIEGMLDQYPSSNEMMKKQIDELKDSLHQTQKKVKTVKK